ncbi:N-acetylneuraminate synthase family protein [Methylobacterium nigriterrae]|uniref:N-acetylneuraminate synthase family protein n=1 Tax=Methylobacterium nigriterrae TaxID=3127512 RepID=UPI003013C709
MNAEHKISDTLFREDVSRQKTAGRFSDYGSEASVFSASPKLKQSRDFMTVAGRRISADSPTFIIAEIGNNHNGSLDLAMGLIDAAADAGADCAKFQMRNLDALYGRAAQDMADNLGVEYVLSLLKRFQLSNDSLLKCFDYTRRRGLIPLCTAWDLPSADVCIDAGLPALKTSSADFTNHELLSYIASRDLPLFCSTGMCEETDIENSVDLLHSFGAQFALLHCNSTYPAPFKDINLEYIARLQEFEACAVGYSGHERDVFVSVAAVAKGARIIERHISLNRDMEGSDHKVSLHPDEFALMVRGIRQVQEALGSARPRSLTQGERLNRVSLGKSLFAKRTIEPGEAIRSDMVTVRGPGQGLPPNRLGDLIGRPAGRQIMVGTAFYDSDIQSHSASIEMSFSFGRPWGIPVRHRDVAKLSRLFKPPVLEFHLSYMDLDLADEKISNVEGEYTIIVHAPELFASDHLLDLTSPDHDYRRRSIFEMQRVVAKTKSLKRRFGHTSRVGIVCNVGGFSENNFLSAKECRTREAILRDSLAVISDPEIEIWPQTMPPYPWHFGGQRFHNLFVTSNDIVRLCDQIGLRVCLDTSHSKLACNVAGTSFDAFLDSVAPLAAHIHIADASGADGEGLQVGDGEIDFQNLLNALDRHCPTASFIPEVWQGHEDDGAGFRKALTLIQEIRASASCQATC